MITEIQKQKGALFFLYSAKLVEFGLITGNHPLTPEGFNIAIGAYDGGLKLTEEEIRNFINEIPEMKNIKEEIFFMIHKMQEIGFDKMKEEIKSLQNEKLG